MKFLATALVSFALMFSFAPSAEATRPIVGFHYTDQCNNFAGKQTVLDMVGTGRYREKNRTADPRDCRLVR